MLHKRVLFVFRQDLRTQDNTALRTAIKNSREVLPIFIHDERALADFWENDPRFGFIRELLENIDRNIQEFWWRLSVYRGIPQEIIQKLVQEQEIEAIYINTSYSLWGKKRDADLKKYCKEAQIGFFSFQDFLLVDPQEVEQRKVFTPFSLLWKTFLIHHPERLLIHSTPLTQTTWVIPNNRREVLDIIPTPYHPFWTVELGKNRMNRDFSGYDALRNIPSMDGSTRLSPYIRFGVFSIREIYNKIQDNPPLLSEIIWREFWYHIAFYFPCIYDTEFQERRRSIEWRTDVNSSDFVRFQKGETGYPLVDAAIRQLISTNWMHNRLRMVVASFLTKNMGFDWRVGEKWFKKYLIDYDEAVNFGNWQWSASVGADPKPIRIFNPLLQSEKFDPEAKFIKKYLPELLAVSPKDIHTLNLDWKYIQPIVDQKISAAAARERYRIKE